MRIRILAVAVITVGSLAGSLSPASAELVRLNTNRITYQTASYYYARGLNNGSVTDYPFGDTRNVDLTERVETATSAVYPAIPDLYASTRSIYTPLDESGALFQFFFEGQRIGDAPGAHFATTVGSTYFTVTERVAYELSGNYGPVGDRSPRGQWHVRLSEQWAGGGRALFEQSEVLYQFHDDLSSDFMLGEIQEDIPGYYAASLEGSTTGTLIPGNVYTLFVTSEASLPTDGDGNTALWGGDVQLLIADPVNIPEPSSFLIALVGLSGVGLMTYWRRRRR